MADAAASTAERASLITPDGEIVVFESGEAFVFSSHPPVDDHEGAASDGQVRSPMPGKVTQLSVKVGEAVKKGQPMVTLEAMKMEHALTAPYDGTVEAVTVTLGDQVSEGAALVKLAAS
jgi:biotin carboxyl carrier protein